jgi:C-terminal processing protease CtpA/Prc/osmotically-inducible protein OsmY
MTTKKTLTIAFALFLAPFMLAVSSAQEVHEFPAVETNSKQEKLIAFSKTFGYVRYFHPSDQASLVDWDQMVIYGAQEVLASNETETTEILLTRLFDPLVVDLAFYRGAAKPKPKTTVAPIHQVLAWHHRGVGTDMKNRLYSSSRTNRSSQFRKRASESVLSSAKLMQGINAGSIRGKQIRCRFSAKVTDDESQLQGWIRVNREGGEKTLTEATADQSVKSKEWKQYEISATVDQDATRLTFGVKFSGSGDALIDSVSVEVKNDDGWEKVRIANGGFEMGERRPDTWMTTGKGYKFSIEKEDTVKGNQAVRISRGVKAVRKSELEIVPNLGEVVDASICGELRIRMPLALPVETRYRTGDSRSTDALVKRVNEIEVSAASQQVLCTANVVLAWNLFQHFYPYFDQVDTDWAKTLELSLARAEQAEDQLDTLNTLKWLVAQLHDGHGRVLHPVETRDTRFLPLSFTWIEDQLVVVASELESVNVGDVVAKINGKDAISVLLQNEELISGSMQWKRFQSTSMISMGRSDQKIVLELVRGQKVFEIATRFSRSAPLMVKKRPAIDLVVEGNSAEENIYYIDMGEVTPEQVRSRMNEFAKAKGLIVDVRGYPKGTEFIFQHMTGQHLQSAKWQVPEQVRPDRVDMADMKTRGRWEMPPMKPRFRGKFIFLTNASAISYAESCMAIVAEYKFAEIVGSPTAGANGNINPFTLPDGYRVCWTGMRVMNHDDSQHHLRGVQPTIPMKPTIVGIREGRDELFDKALEMLQTD